MTKVPIREIRNHTAAVIERVRNGEVITITSNGVPVADLKPIHAGKPRWFSRGELARVLSLQADPGLARVLDVLAGDTTADLDPIR